MTKKVKREKSIEAPEWLMKFSATISSSKILTSISNGFSAIMPIIIMGSIVGLFRDLQITPYQTFIANTGIYDVLNVIYSLTVDLLSLYVVYFFGKEMAAKHGVESHVPGMLSVVAFLITCPLGSITVDDTTTTFISFDYLGSAGLFTAIIVGLLVGRLYALFISKNLTIKMPDGVPPMISESFSGLISTFIIAVIFGVVNAVFSVTSWGSLPACISALVSAPFSAVAGNIVGFTILAMAGCVLWFFGIHGESAFLGIVIPLFLPMALENQAAAAAGEELPNIVGLNFSGAYVNYWVLGLAIAVLLVAKSKRYKMVGRLGVAPAVCAISEPFVFGLPLVMNPIMLIPLLLTRFVSIILPWFCTYIGLVPKLNGTLIATGTPIILSGIMSGGVAIVLMQLVIVAVDCLIFVPFVRSADKMALADEIEAVEN